MPTDPNVGGPDILISEKNDKRVPATSRGHLRAGDDAPLVLAAALFAVAELFHGFDHLRRGLDATPRDVFWLGVAGVFLEVAVVVLAVGRHRWAPLALAVGGSTLAIGYLVAHVLPRHPWFSDSFTSAPSVSAISWLAALGEILAATLLAIAGVTVLRRRGGFASASRPCAGEVPLRVALRHPLALLMILGNIAILVASAVQLAAA